MFLFPDLLKTFSELEMKGEFFTVCCKNEKKMALVRYVQL